MQRLLRLEKFSSFTKKYDNDRIPLGLFARRTQREEAFMANLLRLIWAQIHSGGDHRERNSVENAHRTEKTSAGGRELPTPENRKETEESAGESRGETGAEIRDRAPGGLSLGRTTAESRGETGAEIRDRVPGGQRIPGRRRSGRRVPICLMIQRNGKGYQKKWKGKIFY